MSRLFVRTTASTVATPAQAMVTPTERAHERPSPAESTVPPKRCGREILGHSVQVEKAQDHPADRLEHEHPDERADQRGDLRVDGAPYRGPEDPGERGDEKCAAEAVEPFAERERHVEEAEPDDRRHDDHDQHSEHQSSTHRRPRQELDCDETGAPGRREQRAGDRPVTELVRHQDDPHEQREDRGRQSAIQQDPKLELRVEPISALGAADVPGRDQPGEEQPHEPRSPM